MAITFVNKGTWVTGTTSVSPGIPASMQAGDYMLLLVHTPNQAVTTPSGWSVVATASQGTANTAGAVRLSVFGRLWQSGASAPTVAVTSGTVTTAIIVGYRGTSDTAPVYTESSYAPTATTSVEWLGTLGAPANSMVVLAAAVDTDANSTATMASYSNAQLSSITERHDQSITTGVGGGLVVADGIFTAGGTLASTFATGSTSVTRALATVVLREPSDVTVSVTGVSATGDVGTVVFDDGNRTAALTGTAATGGVGSVSEGTSKGLTGNSATSTLGVVVPARSFALTSTALSAAVGSVGETNTVRLSGTQASGQTGALSETLELALTGTPATGTAGTLVGMGPIPDPTIELLGAEILFFEIVGERSLSVDKTLDLSGLEATGQVGALSTSLSRALTGTSATGAVGTLSPVTSRALTGTSATGAAGTVVMAERVRSVSGVAGTGAVGAVASALSKALTGSGATGAFGTISPALSKALTGSGVTGQTGTVTPFIFFGILLSGVGGSAVVGSIATSRTRAITGTSASGTRGSVTVTRDSVLLGNQILVDQGALAARVQTALSGSQAAAETGTIRYRITFPSGYLSNYSPAVNVAYVPALVNFVVVPGINNRAEVPPDPEDAIEAV